MSGIQTNKFQEILAKARERLEASKEESRIASLASLDTTSHSLQMNGVEEVDLSNLGLGEDSEEEEVIEVIQDIHSAAEIPDSLSQKIDLLTEVPAHKLTAKERNKLKGVAADVTLNQKQKLFMETALSGEDICLIGAAGTGKTTVVGKFTNALIESGDLEELGSDTKWLRANVPGVLICSFTRKAVNNIKRAVSDLLKPHVLTIHKVLEFAPVFYEIWDQKNNCMKKTMKFEPQRGAFNPLPRNLKLIAYEESSMIGTDLYNLLIAALPHSPQEIFIGDIHQLPPIFGPAILGFKMSLLQVVQLDEVYRQALLSPIIRLAHSILSGDSSKFSAQTASIKNYVHPFVIDPKTQKPLIIKDYKSVPALEAFNEAGEYGEVKFQIWQKSLEKSVAENVSVMQFQAWKNIGYYNPDEDVILCPFNKSFGTIELNKGISNFLGKERGAVVHEVIAREQKHYLALGDRVLFDKEDATIISIKRNMTYLGKSPLHPSPFLDRWGTLQKEKTDEELAQEAKEDAEFGIASMDKFLESFGDDDEDKTNAASHAIEIQFTYSDETMILSGSGEVNDLLGGYAITVHKMQGSEAENVFLLLHSSHSGPLLNNELLYTAVTRARKKLHIICETDSFFKGVKSHKVRGVTLEDKIDFFKGKGEFKQMEEEAEFLKRQKELKRRRLEEVRKRELESEEADWRVLGVIDRESGDTLYFDPDLKTIEGTVEEIEEPDHLEIDYTLLDPKGKNLRDKQDAVHEVLTSSSDSIRDSETPINDILSTSKEEPQEPTRILTPTEKIRLLLAKRRNTQ